VTDDSLRAYYLHPEIHPVEESGDAELELHDSLMQAPRRAVTERELRAIEDADARDNYRVLLKFRDRLLETPSVEACYMNFFKGAIDVPPLFIDQLAHVILRTSSTAATMRCVYVPRSSFSVSRRRRSKAVMRSSPTSRRSKRTPPAAATAPSAS